MAQTWNLSKILEDKRMDINSFGCTAILGIGKKQYLNTLLQPIFLKIKERTLIVLDVWPSMAWEDGPEDEGNYRIEAGVSQSSTSF